MRMLQVIISVALATVNGWFWYNTSIGFGRVWASHAWPGKTIEDIGRIQDQSTYIITMFSQVLSMILFSMVLR